MKFTKIVLCLAAVCALAACDGQGVSAERFAEEAKKVEKHQYKEAVFNYSSEYDVLGAKQEAKGEIEYTFKDGEWDTDSKDANALGYEMMLYVNVASFDGSSLEIPEEAKQYNPKVGYYINPFQVKASLNKKVDEDGFKGTVKLSAIEQFDKYGYMTKLKVDYDNNQIEEKAGIKTVYRTIIKMDISVSYK